MQAASRPLASCEQMSDSVLLGIDALMMSLLDDLKRPVQLPWPSPLEKEVRPRVARPGLESAFAAPSFWRGDFYIWAAYLVHVALYCHDQP